MSSTDVLLAEAQSGSPKALNDLMARSQVQIISQAMRWARNVETALDIAQDASMILVRRIASCKIAWRGFVCKSTRFACLTRLRKEDANRRLQQPSESNSSGWHLPADDPSPIEAAMKSETEARLRAAVEKLPKKLRVAVKLHFWENLSYQAIGTSIGVSAEAARKRCNRAIDILAERMARYADER